MKKITDGRILIVNDHSLYTGIGKYILNILSHVRENRDVDMLFLCHRDNQKFNGYNGSIKKLETEFTDIIAGEPITDMFNYHYFPEMFQNEYNNGYLLYHISSQLLGRFCEKTSPTVITCHDLIHRMVKGNHHPVSCRIRDAHIESMRYAEKIISISKFTTDDMIRIYGFDPEKIEIIYHGVDGNIFKPGDKSVARKKLNLPEDTNILINIGSEYPRKNIPFLMHAIKEIDKKDNTLLLRVGRSRKENIELVNKLGLGDRVRYYRNIKENELPLFYHAADAAVFPSYYEGFGMPVLEAFSSGCPVIASNATSIPEVAGNAAILFDPHDIEDLKKKTNKVLSEHSLREEFKVKGIERAKELPWEKTARLTNELYDDVIREHNSV